MTTLHRWVDPEEGLYCETVRRLGAGLEAETVVEYEQIRHPRTGALPAWAHSLIPQHE